MNKDNPSFFAVRKAGKRYTIDMVTPIKGMAPIRTTIARAGTRDQAEVFARGEAARSGIPFRE